MRFSLTNRGSMNRRHELALAGVLTVALCLGFLISLPASTVPVVHAACGIFPGWCPFNDMTRTSSLSVSHAYDAGEYDVWVEPDDTDSWTITGTWSTPFSTLYPDCSCVDMTSSVTADVTWSDATNSWSVSCTGCNAVNGPIYAVGVCIDGASCGSGAVVDNTAGYKLYVDVAQQPNYPCVVSPPQPAYIYSVEYTTTSVDDGNLLNMVACTEGSSVTPTSQTWSQTDYGTF